MFIFAFDHGRTAGSGGRKLCADTGAAINNITTAILPMRLIPVLAPLKKGYSFAPSPTGETDEVRRRGAGMVPRPHRPVKPWIGDNLSYFVTLSRYEKGLD